MERSLNTEIEDLEERLREIIRHCAWYETLRSIRSLDLPDWWVAGGAIRNTAWKHLYGDECKLQIKDIDVVFFDRESGKEFELKNKELLQSIHPDWIFDVKNQASFGHWRTWHFQFTDSSDGIAHFLHTATAVGVRLLQDETLLLHTPYGLRDLFEGQIRPTPFRHAEESSIKKQNEYLSKCPRLLAAPKT